MSSKTSANRQVFRQRASLGLAATCAVVGVLLLLSLVRDWARDPQPLFAAWVLFGLALAWSVLVRPAVVVDANGVTLRNVIRDVHIPWALVTEVTTRWNLRIEVADRGYTAWAISSQVERPRVSSRGRFTVAVPGLPPRAPEADARLSAISSKVTAQSVAKAVNAAKREYGESLPRVPPPATSGGTVRTTWVPLSMAALLLPAIAVAVLSLT